MKFPLPAVLTIDEGIARPRLASLKGIMAAKKKPLEVKPAAARRGGSTSIAMALPPSASAGRIIAGSDAPELVRLLQDGSQGAVMADISRSRRRGAESCARLHSKR